MLKKILKWLSISFCFVLLLFGCIILISNITPVDMCLGRGVCSLRMKNGNQEFLYYLMKYYMPQLINKESGTVFGKIMADETMFNNTLASYTVSAAFVGISFGSFCAFLFLMIKAILSAWFIQGGKVLALYLMQFL